MTATTPGPGEDAGLFIREQIARIDRALAESDKFRAEHTKLMAESEKIATENRKLLAESDKFLAERRKLNAEAAKYDRDRYLAPVLASVTVIGALVGGASILFNLYLKLPAGPTP